MSLPVESVQRNSICTLTSCKIDLIMMQYEGKEWFFLVIWILTSARELAWNKLL